MPEFGNSRGEQRSPGSKAEPHKQEAQRAAPSQGAPFSKDSLELPKVPLAEDQSKKNGYRPEQIFELIRGKRLEIATAFGFKGEVLARCAKASALPAEVILRLKPFEDRAKGVLGKVRVCSDALGRLEKVLNKAILYTDVLALAHQSQLKALHPVRDHATTQRFLASIKGTPRDEMLDRLFSVVSTARKQRCDMRIVVKVLEAGRDAEKRDPQ